ncbi:hypothetical protein [Micromonospora profundi]|uniref:hypothetical protein n=1 Tax=Micromonospora profundi TaxID=1420889 RepID=UPI003667CBA8
MDEGRVWRLYRRGELVGEIDEQGRDFPWTYGRFRPLAGFEPLRPLFIARNAALDADDDEAMIRIDEDIRAALTMAGQRIVDRFEIRPRQPVDHEIDGSNSTSMPDPPIRISDPFTYVVAEARGGSPPKG